MAPRKVRVTVTVDTELVEAGQRAVQSGQAESISGWVSAALVDKVRRDAKLALLAAAVADYEGEFGAISGEEIRAQRRADRQDAVVVRSRQTRKARKARNA